MWYDYGMCWYVCVGKYIYSNNLNIYTDHLLCASTVLAIWKYKIQTFMELTIRWEEKTSIRSITYSVNSGSIVVCAIKKSKAEYEAKWQGKSMN